MRLAILIAAMIASPVAAQPFVVQPTGRSYATLDEAVKAIGDGDAAILIAPGTYHECAVQTQGRITYRATVPGSVTFERAVCEDKAALVLRGRAATVEGLVFRHFGVADGNGAGVRLEKGALTVRDSAFRDSEEGIIGNDDAAADIVVDRSTFSGLGRCDRDLSCAHSIYIGFYRSLTVTRSRFERGRGGHYVKSRAGRIAVSDCSFDDTGGRTTNYMIDLSAGATGRIERNIFVQGLDKENHSAFIAVAAESRTNVSAGLTVTGNKAHQVDGVTWPSAFVADFSQSPMRVEGNEIGPRITPYSGVASQENPTLIGRMRHYFGRAKDKVREKLLG
jgi:hypothetical protein